MRYYLNAAGRAFGPYSVESIRDMLASGRLRPDTKVSIDKQNWQALEELSEFRSAPTSDGSTSSGGDVERGEQAPDLDARQWYYCEEGSNSSGPVSAREVFRVYTSRRSSGRFYVCRAGEQWRDLREEDAFRKLLNQENAESATSSTTSSATPPSFPASKKWFLSLDGRSTFGSFDASRLREMLESGEASPEAIVWREGGPGFRLGACPELQEEWSKRVETRAFPPEYETSRRDVGNDPFARKRPTDLTPKLNFCFWATWGLTIAACLFACSVVVLLIFDCVVSKRASLEFGAIALLGSSIASTILCWFCSAACVFAVVFFFAFLYHFWRILPPSGARTTPECAVGLLFLPGFNLFWFFESVRGGALDLNAALEVAASRRHVSYKPVNVALATCVCVLYLLGGPFGPFSLFFLIGLFLLASQMRRGAAQLDLWLNEGV